MEAFALSPDAVRVPLPQRLLSDDRLLRLAAAGNPQAFGAVYARYHAPLYAYCRSIVRDPDDARDALQNAMMKALAALGRGEDRDLPLKPWLFRIAHNEAISLLRRRRPSEPLTDAVSPPVADVGTQVVARERLSQLVDDLQALPERQRAALLMREVSGLEYDEIAATLGVSSGAARQTVFEARSALSEYNEGRDVACEQIRRSISDGDGRAMRARRVRAHLRSCNACRDFQTTLTVRRRELALLAPGLSGGGAVALLQAVLGAGAGAGLAAGGGAAAGGAGLLGGSASAILATGAAKSVVVLAAVTAAGVGATEVAHVGRAHRYRKADIPSASAPAQPAARAASAGTPSSHAAASRRGPAAGAASGLDGPVFPVRDGSGSGRSRSHGQVVALPRPDDALLGPLGDAGDAGSADDGSNGFSGPNGKGPLPHGSGQGAGDGYSGQGTGDGYSGWAARPAQPARPVVRPSRPAPAAAEGDTADDDPGYSGWANRPRPDRPARPSRHPAPAASDDAGYDDSAYADGSDDSGSDDSAYADSSDGSGYGSSAYDDASADDSSADDSSSDDTPPPAPARPVNPAPQAPGGSGSGSGGGRRPIGSGSSGGWHHSGSGSGATSTGGDASGSMPPADPAADGE